MITCTFFGHRNVLVCSPIEIENAIEALIKEYKDVRFLVGDHGRFDYEVKNILVGLKQKYANIDLVWVLTSVKKYLCLEKENRNYRYYDYKIYDIELLHYKKIITFTNKRMVDECDYVICAVDMDKFFSGAVAAVKYAIKKNKKVINLCETNWIIFI